jgi:uncharacterized membrane protein YjgN (DUF898 family)
VQDNHKALEAAAGTVALQFTGRAGEYFSIWIVNLSLSIITLGIYSAWAKVRRKRYFCGNTFLNDSTFDYLADPKTILKGRIIVVAAFVAYSLVKDIQPIVGLVLILAFLAALPWLIVRAMRFNAWNTAHRNVRFGFHGTYGGLCAALSLPALLAIVTIGLAYPYFAYRKDKFIVEQSSYGTTRFAFCAAVGDYYLACVKVFAAGLGFLAGSVVTLGIGALPLYILARAYAVATMGRLKWMNTTLSDIHFDCAWTTTGLFKLNLLNALGVIFSFGLLIPWAAIRAAKYTLEGLSLRPASAISGFITANQAQVAALGEEAGELLGFDFGL